MRVRRGVSGGAAWRTGSRTGRCIRRTSRATAWRLPCLSYLVRSEGVTILVDTGVGPPGLWDWTAEDEGLLPGALEAAGVGLDQIDVVFLTHLDIDHVGWNTDLDGVPLFPAPATSCTPTRSRSR